jgi:acetolactate synthase-1/2/3 large subunit
MPTAAQVIVQALIANGVDHVFCVPGESYLAVLDALESARDRIRLIACRHEAGAANMAEAYGKLTGRPGVCMVTRGPGATHASVGVHTAEQDSTPMILLIGQVERAHRDRGAFQEMDHAAVFGSFAKWAAENPHPSLTGEMIARAFAVALEGRRGPVVLALPEDLLTEPAEGVVPARVEPVRQVLDPATLAAIGARLREAERPVAILGGSGWTAEARAAIGAWLEAGQLPTALSFRRKDLLDNDSPSYIGDLGLPPDPRLVERLRAADLVLALGARLGDNPTQGYGLFTPEQTSQRLVHIHPDARELGRVWPFALAAAADPAAAALALASVELAPRPGWNAWRAGGRTDYEAFRRSVAVTGRVNLSDVVAHLAEALPADAIVCNGAGNFAAWLHRFYRHRAWPTQLAPTSGAMGYGLPAAIAAKLVHPDREVVCFAGDGDFLMTGQELATAVQYGAKAVAIVADNSSYGTIRAHQERRYPGRISGTDLKNPDFAAFARSFGCWAARVERTADFPAALAEARAAESPALIHLLTDVEDIAPGRTLTELRGASR